MKHPLFKTWVFSAFAAMATLIFTPSSEAQTLSGSNVDSRVLIGLAVDNDAVQSRMPDGWTALTFPKGPMKGANLLLGFEDRAVALDADGKPRSPSASRAVAVLGLAKQAEGKDVRLYVLRVYSTAPELLPYGNAVRADILRSTTRTDLADGAQSRTDSWVASVADGQIALKLDFATGRRGWSPSKAKLFSAADPSVVRIFDYTQMVDVLQSDGLGKPFTGTVEMNSSVTEMADLLGGSEKIVAILDIPVYVRQVFVP